MIAILAMGVALAGVILTSLRGTEARLDAQIKDLRGEVGELRERMAHLKGCWKDCARPSPSGRRPAEDGSTQHLRLQLPHIRSRSP